MQSFCNFYKLIAWTNNPSQRMQVEQDERKNQNKYRFKYKHKCKYKDKHKYKYKYKYNWFRMSWQLFLSDFELSSTGSRRGLPVSGQKHLMNIAGNKQS